MKIPSQDIHQGDILILENKQEVPADCILLYCSNDSKMAFINTASLDGESNLKPKNQIVPFSFKN